jgi:ferrochelatase
MPYSLNKTAVVLLNLGGPDSLESVEHFLFNLFYDKSIITLPNPMRFLIAKIISKTRAKTAEEIYKLVGGRSPILQETKAQRDALEKNLRQHGDAKVFICMRHWNPRAEEVVQEIAKYDPAQIIILPLYPQFSTTTTGSGVDDLQIAIKNSAVIAPQKVVCCYYENADFISAHASLIKEAMAGLDVQGMKVLFSAHSLPQKIVDQGDPYQWQVEKTVAAVVKKLNIPELDYCITYQSKVGPLKWLGPNTQHEIEKAATHGKSIVVVPIAFVSEHVETLVELDIEYAKIAHDYGVRYIRVPTLSVCELFVSALTKIILEFAKEDKNLTRPDILSKRCPEQFSGCICNRR